LVLLVAAPVWLRYTGSADAQEVTVVILTRTFEARTNIFTRPQEELWNQLGDQLPEHWVLYGDTALGTRMGRPSPDFEFKSARHFNPEYLLDRVPFLRDAQVLESRWSHLKVAVGGPTPVEITFDGGQTIAQIHPPERASNGLAVASLADLAGEKMHRISQQPMAKDCRDVAALIREGTSIHEMLGCAKAMYGERFDYEEALKNLTSVDRSGLHLDRETELLLIKEGAMGFEGAMGLSKTGQSIDSERITTEPREPAQRIRREQNFERAVDPYDLRDPFDRPPFERG
jgi:hypothetical protein